MTTLAEESPGSAPPGRGNADTATRDRGRMARGGGLNLVGAVAQQLCQLLIVAAVAHLAGKSDVGRYAECFALVSLLGLLSLAGFRAGLTKFVAMHLADGDAARLRGTVRLGLGITAAGSTVLAIALALLAPWVAGLLGDPAIVTGVRLVALSLLPGALSEAALAATQGWRSQKAFTLIGRIFDPVLRLGGTVVLLGLGFDYVGAMIALAVTSWLTCALALGALWRRMRRVERVAPVHELGELLSFSMVSWLSALAATGLIWADTLILGAMTDAGEVGVYNVASRLVTLAVFVLPPITATFQPHMAHLYHVGDLPEAARAYGAATRWTMLLSMPAFVLLLLFPGDLLTFFGSGFVDGAVITLVLAIGQLVGAATGPCGVVLNMSGRVRLSLLDNGLVLALNVALNLLLIPRLGILGAALAWSGSIVVVNVVKLVQARVIVGISADGAMLGKISLAAFVAACGGLIVQDRVQASFPAVVLGALTIGVIYVTIIGTLRPHPDDVAIAAGFLRKGRRKRPVRAGRRPG